MHARRKKRRRACEVNGIQGGKKENHARKARKPAAWTAEKSKRARTAKRKKAGLQSNRKQAHVQGGSPAKENVQSERRQACAAPKCVASNRAKCAVMAFRQAGPGKDPQHDGRAADRRPFAVVTPSYPKPLPDSVLRRSFPGSTRTPRLCRDA